MSNNDENIFIGIDSGTSLVKCVAFTASGELLTSASTENNYSSSGEDCAEQDMSVTSENVLQTLKALVGQLGSASRNVKAVSVTGQGDGMWLTDRNGAPIHKAWLWLDSRAASIATELEKNRDYQRLFELTGTAVNAAQTRTQMLWLERNDPQLLDRAASCFHCKDYLYFVLTGERATDPGEALFTFGDFARRTYSDEVLSILNLSHRASLLPPIVDGLNTAATILPTISDLTGLPADTQINLAPVDVICSALGGGLYDRGSISAMTLIGTTGVHMRYSSEDVELTLPADQTGYTIVFPGGGYAQLQSNMSATMNIDWLVSLIEDSVAFCGQKIGRADILKQLDQLVNEGAIASALYLPYISTAGERGPFFDANARAGFTGLDQQSGLKDIARAVYEGICFAARDCYDDLGELPDQIKVTGGGARSAILVQTLANVMNRPIRTIEREESGAAGAAMISAVQQGYYESVSACVQEWVTPYMGSAVEPSTEHSALYQRLFPVYKAHRKTQSATWQHLAEIRTAQQDLSAEPAQGESL